MMSMNQDVSIHAVCVCVCVCVSMTDWSNYVLSCLITVDHYHWCHWSSL